MTIGFGCAMAPNSFDSIGMEDEVEKVIECDLVDDDAFRTLEQKCNEAIKKWGQYYMWKDEFGGFWREFFEQAVFYGAINIAKYLNETRGMFKDIEDSETNICLEYLTFGTTWIKWNNKTIEENKDQWIEIEDDELRVMLGKNRIISRKKAIRLPNLTKKSFVKTKDNHIFCPVDPYTLYIAIKKRNKRNSDTDTSDSDDDEDNTDENIRKDLEFFIKDFEAPRSFSYKNLASCEFAIPVLHIALRGWEVAKHRKRHGWMRGRHWLAEKNQFAMIKYLLSNGASANANDFKGRIPMDFILGSDTKLYRELNKGTVVERREVIDIASTFMKEMNMNLSDFVVQNGWNIILLSYAAITNDVECIRHITNGNLIYNDKKSPVYLETDTRTFQKRMLDEMADEVAQEGTSAFGNKLWPINNLGSIMKFAKPDARKALLEANTFLRFKYKELNNDELSQKKRKTAPISKKLSSEPPVLMKKRKTSKQKLTHSSSSKVDSDGEDFMS